MLGDNNPNVTTVTRGLESQLNDVSKMADNLMDKFNQLNSSIGNSDSVSNYARNVQMAMSNVKLYIDDVKNSMDSLKIGDNDNVLNNFSNIESRVKSMHDTMVQVFQSIPNEIKNSFGSTFTDLESNINQMKREIDNLGKNIEPAFNSATSGMDRFNQSASNVNSTLGQLNSTLERDESALRSIAQNVGPIIGNFGELNKILQVSQENSSKLEQELKKFDNLNISPVSKGEMDAISSVLKTLQSTFDKEALNVSKSPDEILKPFEQLINMLNGVSSKLESSAKSLNTSDLNSLGAINRIDDSLNYLNRINSVIKDTQEKMNSFIDSQQLSNGADLKEQINKSLEGRLDFFRQIDQQIDQFRNNSRANFGQSLNNINTPGTNDYQLVNMALGNNYQGLLSQNIGSLARGATSLVRQGERVERSWDWDSDASNPVQKFRSRSSIDIKSANQEAENLQRLSVAYQTIEKTLMSEISKANNPNLASSERSQAKDLALENYKRLAQTQSQINQSGINLSNDIDINNRHEYNGLDPTSKRWVDQVKSVLKNIEESNDNLLSVGKMLGLDQTEQNIRDLNRYKDALNDIGDTLDKDTTRSKSLWESFKSGVGFLNQGGSFLSKIAGIFGVGALPLTLAGGLNFASGITDAYTQQGDYKTQGAMADLNAGLYGYDSQLKNRVYQQGEQYYSSTHGLIGFQDYNNAYINLAKNVGGQVGEDKSGAANDLNNIVQNTFSMSKVYNISDSQLAQSVQTFYKDLGMSANETITTLQNLASTANASNIPVNQYLQIVTNLAAQYRQLGLSGTDAQNVMSNLLQSGITNINVAQEMAQGVGQAIGHFGDNRTQSAYAGMISGQFSNPWSAVAANENRLDENGNVRVGYGDMVAKEIDAMLNQRGVMTSGDKGLEYDTIYQYLKTNLGWNNDQSNVGAVRYMNGDKKLFEDFIKNDGKIDGKKPGEDENSIEAQTRKFDAQLATASENLAGTTKVTATLKDAQYKLATETTPLLDNAFNFLNKTVNNAATEVEKALGGLANFLNDFVKNNQGLLNTLSEHPLETLGGALIATSFGPSILKGTTKLAGKGFSSLWNKIKGGASEVTDDVVGGAERSGSSVIDSTIGRTALESSSLFDEAAVALGGVDSAAGSAASASAGAVSGGVLKGLSKFIGPVGSLLASLPESISDFSHGKIGTGVGNMVGTTGGGWAGAEAGAAIGALFGGVGAIPGAIIGGGLGSFFGGKLGSKAGGVLDNGSETDSTTKLSTLRTNPNVTNSSSPNSYEASNAREEAAKKNSQHLQPLFEDISKAQKDSSDKNAQSTRDSIFTNAKAQIDSLTGFKDTNKVALESVVTNIQNSSATESQKLDELASLLKTINISGGSNTTASHTSDTSNEGKIWNFLADKGFSPVAISGIMGNFKQESDLDPNATNPTSRAYGLAQWLGGRKDGLSQFAKQTGGNVSSIDTQLQYMWHELQTSEWKTLGDINKATTPEEAAQIFEKDYERGNPGELLMNKRVNAANDYYNRYSTNGGLTVGSGGITPGFVEPLDSYTVTDSYAAHLAAGRVGGIDLAAAKGTAIHSATSGTVVESDYNNSWGNTVVIKDASGKEYRYAHLESSSPFDAGSSVSAGQVIGKVGSTGNSTGPHLHFTEYDSAGNVIDPTSDILNGYKSAMTSGDNGDNGSSDGSGTKLDVTPIYATAMVTCSVLNVRSGPSTNSKVVGSMKKGEQSVVSGKTNNGWYRLTYANQDAYVFGQYLSISGESSSSGSAPASSSIPSAADVSGLVNTSGYDASNPSTWTSSGSPFARGTLINNLIGASSMSSYYNNDPNSAFDALATARDINNKGGTDGDVTINQQSMARNLLMNLNKASGMSSSNNKFADTLTSDTSTTYRPSIDSIMDVSSGPNSSSNSPNYALTVTLDKNGQSDEQYNALVQNIMDVVKNMGGEIKDVKQSVSDVQNSLLDTNYTIAANNQVIYGYNRG